MIRTAVIIVNYNGGEMLRRCLAAVSAQTEPPARVLVMDNGSRDGSIDACRADFPRVEFRLLDANLGFARANNVGIDEVADCDWVALLNPDAFPAPTWIEELHRGAREFPGVPAFASCMLSAANPVVADGAGDAYRVDGLAWPRHQGGPSSGMPRRPEEVFSPSAGAGFYRRDALIAVGGLCERFFCYYEDVDLGFRLRLRGGTCQYLPRAVVKHMGSAISGGQASQFSVYHAHRNFVWTFVRNMPGKYFLFYAPAHVLANLASVALFVRKGQGRTILKAKRDALLGLPKAFAERRQIQAARLVEPSAVVAAMQRGNLFTTLFRMARSSVGQAAGRTN
jgi:GT2 family glycosyltransferase